MKTAFDQGNQLHEILDTCTLVFYGFGIIILHLACIINDYNQV